MQKSEIKVVKLQQKWNDAFPNETLYWKTIYLVELKSTNVIKVRKFQYKFLMRIIPTYKFLSKCHITNSTLCEFCNMEIETVSHPFRECIYVQGFWTLLRNFLNQCQMNIDIDFKTMTFGLCHKINNKSVQVKNFIIFSSQTVYLSKQTSKNYTNFLSFQTFSLIKNSN